MKVFDCDGLVPGCDAVITGDSEEEILDKVAVHAREEHGMDEVPPEVQDKVRASIAER